VLPKQRHVTSHCTPHSDSESHCLPIPDDKRQLTTDNWQLTTTDTYWRQTTTTYGNDNATSWQTRRGGICGPKRASFGPRYISFLYFFTFLLIYHIYSDYVLHNNPQTPPSLQMRVGGVTGTTCITPTTDPPSPQTRVGGPLLPVSDPWTPPSLEKRVGGVTTCITPTTDPPLPQTWWWAVFTQYLCTPPSLQTQVGGVFLYFN